jgi:riboflavin biosynthesis pyrimidine reductase
LHHTQHRPHIINIMLSSLNGKIAQDGTQSTRDRHLFGFTCDDDFQQMISLVSECDAVFIGASSMSVEAGAFRTAHLRLKKDEPEWIVFTQSGQINFQNPFWHQEGIPKSVFFSTSFSPQEKPILKEVPGDLHTDYVGNIGGLLENLYKKGMRKIALLGGGRLNAAFYKAGLVDELYLTLAPQFVCSELCIDLIYSVERHNMPFCINKIELKNNFIYLQATPQYSQTVSYDVDR